MEAIVDMAFRDEDVAQVILEKVLNDSDFEVVEIAKRMLQDVEFESKFDDQRQLFSFWPCPSCLGISEFNRTG